MCIAPSGEGVSSPCVLGCFSAGLLRLVGTSCSSRTHSTYTCDVCCVCDLSVCVVCVCALVGMSWGYGSMSDWMC